MSLPLIEVFVILRIANDDTQEDLVYMSRSVKDTGLEVLCDFHDSMKSDEAKEMYERFLKKMKKKNMLKIELKMAMMNVITLELGFT
ncbi:25057_t:CDS:2 [Dentiscutata erythropus]|uniref:25057_t:CDS:1 n=1 Tax=Dentiscutata erythropus TaxID=1348616 RepID=A0A9N9NIU2_9GLOM|nr:25057_t:CDS:2 [Dentiscutata erythropus]